MENSKTYPDLPEGSSVKEAEMAYLASLPYMSREEALKDGIPLEESRRLLFERIRQDFQQKI